MSQPKTHHAVEARNAIGYESACGRGRRLAETPSRVTCDLCKAKPAFIEAKARVDAARQAAFEAQVPRTFSEPWHQPYGSVPMVCKGCGGDQFRHGDRTCMGHYDNFHCAACGHIESRLTETGMSF